MSYIKFNNSPSRINGIIKPITPNIIEVNQPLNQSGLNLYLDNDMLIGDYNSYTTLYRKIDDSTYQYSNDGSVYVEPEPIIIPEPIPPTEEELAEIARQEKIVELTLNINTLKSEIVSYDYIFTKRQEIELIEDEIYKAEQLAQYELDYPSDVLQPIIKLRVGKRSEINLLEEELGKL